MINHGIPNALLAATDIPPDKSPSASAINHLCGLLGAEYGETLPCYTLSIIILDNTRIRAIFRDAWSKQ